MTQRRWLFVAGLSLAAMMAGPAVGPVVSESQAPPAPQGRGGRAGGGGSAFPQRPPQDPAAVERGRGLFSVHCGFCHGSDARGATTGPNLWRSALVLADKAGESIGQVIREGRPDKGMPKMDLTAPQVSDVVAFLHSLPIGGRDPARMRPVSIVVGDARAGETYFQKTCSSCHSTTGDLKGLATAVPG